MLKVEIKHQFFTNQKCFIITGSSLAYLTAFFNSNLFRFAFKEYFPELLGDTRELSKVFFENVTVLEVDTSTNGLFDKLVSNIEKLKAQKLPDDTIKQAVEEKLAQIYSLSASEISLIESSEKASALTFPEINALSDVVSS